nr:14.5 kDa unknown protein [Oyster mushroom spherical virus]
MTPSNIGPALGLTQLFGISVVHALSAPTSTQMKFAHVWLPGIRTSTPLITFPMAGTVFAPPITSLRPTRLASMRPGCWTAAISPLTTAPMTLSFWSRMVPTISSLSSQLTVTWCGQSDTLTRPRSYSFLISPAFHR